MADLRDMDPAQPVLSGSVGQGDDQIRDLKLHLKGSFFGAATGPAGAAAPEHYPGGAHKFIYGAPGVRPPAGHAGRIFFDTTNNRVERDDGSVWRLLHVAQPGFQHVSGPLVLTSAYQDLAIVTVDVPTDGIVVAFALGMFTGFANNTGVFAIIADGVTVMLPPGEVTVAIGPSGFGLISLIGVHNSLSLGSHTIAFRGKSAVAALAVSLRSIVTLVV